MRRDARRSYKVLPLKTAKHRLKSTEMGVVHNVTPSNFIVQSVKYLNLFYNRLLGMQTRSVFTETPRVIAISLTLRPDQNGLSEIYKMCATMSRKFDHVTCDVGKSETLTYKCMNRAIPR